MARQLAGLTVVLAALIGAAAARALPPGFNQAQVVSGLSSPTAMAIAPDGRLFVAEQGGTLRVISNGALLATPFLTLTVDSAGERGLLGVAFDPGFASNQFVYVYYTVPGSPAHNRVSRFLASGDVATPGSELPILDLDNLTGATNHNGGAIHFGADGKLYVGVGENANPSNAQTLGNRLGKVLRIDADGTIPTDNPFYGMATGANRAIWALGLRNPFTFAVQPGTGRIFIDDVGQNTWEEINDGIAMANYGWPTCEGICGNANFRDPLLAYGHSGTPPVGCAIAGGTFYNPSTVQFPGGYAGKYFFSDLCSGWIRLFDPLNPGTSTDFATGFVQPVDLAVGSDGSLYSLSRGPGPGATGAVDRITYSAATAVVVSSFTAHRTGRSVLVRWHIGDPRVLGVDVFRGATGGHRVRLNRVLVGGGRFVDRTALGRGAPRYWLRVAFGDGTRRWYGPARFSSNF